MTHFPKIPDTADKRDGTVEFYRFDVIVTRRCKTVKSCQAQLIAFIWWV